MNIVHITTDMSTCVCYRSTEVILKEMCKRRLLMHDERYTAYIHWGVRDVKYEFIEQHFTKIQIMRSTSVKEYSLFFLCIVFFRAQIRRHARFHVLLEV